MSSSQRSSWRNTNFSCSHSTNSALDHHCEHTLRHSELLCRGHTGENVFLPASPACHFRATAWRTWRKHREAPINSSTTAVGLQQNIQTSLPQSERNLRGTEEGFSSADTVLLSKQFLPDLFSAPFCGEIWTSQHDSPCLSFISILKLDYVLLQSSLLCL